MANTEINSWEKLKYVNPREALPKLLAIQKLASSSNLKPTVKNLRTNLLKRHREGWEASLFCYGMGKLLDSTIFVCPYENSDYDAISLRRENNTAIYTPIQIKEVVPEDLNPDSTINKEIAKLKNRYKDTIVVIHINRAGRLDLSKIIIPDLILAELWLLGASSSDQNKWFIAGDLLKAPTIFEFDFPN